MPQRYTSFLKNGLHSSLKAFPKSQIAKKNRDVPYSHVIVSRAAAGYGRQLKIELKLIHATFLFQAYDNVESSVRKASVFCMVALHQLVGDQMQPHLSSLNGSKLKLLNLYIKRAEAQSTPASPRLTPP